MLVHILSSKSPITGPSSPTWCNTPKWSPTQFKASNRVVLLRVQGNELRLVYVIWMPFNWPKLLRNPFHKKANDHYLSYIRITQSARHGALVIKACSYEDEQSKASVKKFRGVVLSEKNLDRCHSWQLIIFFVSYSSALIPVDLCFRNYSRRIRYSREFSKYHPLIFHNLEKFVNRMRWMTWIYRLT